MNDLFDNYKYKLRMLSATKWIIIVCLIAFAVTQILAQRYGDTGALLLLGANDSVLVAHGQIWRLFTALFLHANLLHIVFNMYALNSIGEEIEYTFGVKKYLSIYFITGIVANIVSNLAAIYSPFAGSPLIEHISVGASGAIFGLLGYLLMKKLRERDLILSGRSLNIDLKALIMVIGINLVFGFSVAGIDNNAHLGGLVCGFLFGLFI